VAQMFPEEFRLDADSPSEAERILYEAFRTQLDDRYAVFHRCAWLAVDPKGSARDGEIDFVIARPDLGVLCLEAKGGGLGRDAKTGEWYKVDWRGRRGASLDDPAKQAVRNKNGLLARLKEMPGAPRRWWTIGHAVAFPEIEFALDAPGLKPEIVLDRRSVGHLADWTERALRFWADAERHEAPGAEGIALLTRLLGLSFEIAPRIGAQMGRDDREIATLTLQQFKALEGLTRCRRVLVCGCAGSGKTMLALEKAKRLAAQGFRVLFLCYNKHLRDFCREFLRGHGRIAVDNFHGLCAEWARKAGLAVEWGEGDRFWRVELPGLFRKSIPKVKERFDAIVVDEGQDFDPPWWGPLESMLEDRARGVLYIFYDDNQLLYNDQLEFPSDMVPFDLTENCRNTKRIHELVQRYYRGERAFRSAGPAGWKPEISTYRTTEDLLEQVEAAVKRFTGTQKIPPNHLVVLTGHGKEKSAVWRARRFGGFALTDQRVAREGELRWSSVHAFKGLESAAAILCEIEPLSHTELERVLYVGCSRARLHLAVIASEAAAGLGKLGDAAGRGVIHF